MPDPNVPGQGPQSPQEWPPPQPEQPQSPQGAPGGPPPAQAWQQQQPQGWQAQPQAGWQQPPPGGPPGAPPGYGPAPVTPWQADASARQWAMAAHLSALAGIVIGLNWLVPLIIYLVKKDDHPFIADQAREALNFNLSVFIYFIAGGIVTLMLTLVLIGLLLIPVLIAAGIAWLVLAIVAGVKANSGVAYRYPLTIRMVS